MYISCIFYYQGKGRIYVNTKGINAQMCVPAENIESTQNLFKELLGLSDIEFRIQHADFQVFNRLREAQEIVLCKCFIFNLTCQC